tara:strand:+ start:859 stop:1407 length:549 start_codon:yes stop_codon:yes gene_type:complete
MTIQRYPLNTATKSIYGTGSSEFSTSGASDTNTTTEWRVHIQNIEIMYERVVQYKTTDGTPDFNYLECAFTIDASREHIFTNASAGDMTQLQVLDLLSDSHTGSLGNSGVIRTALAGVTRREVRAGDTESRTRSSGNIIVGKMPGLYTSSFDVSANTNSTILDMLIAAKANCPEFELSLVDL